MAPIPPTSQRAQPIRSSMSDPRRLLIILLFGIVGNLLLVAIVQIVYRMEASSKVASVTNPTQPVTVPTPTLPCLNSWKREAQHIGDHRNEETNYFDVGPTPPGCFSELIYAPSDWSRWSKMVVGGSPDCLTWFWPFGDERPIGPFKPNELPEFPVTTPHPWRISTECTIKYFRTV